MEGCFVETGMRELHEFLVCVGFLYTYALCVCVLELLQVLKVGSLLSKFQKI